MNLPLISVIVPVYKVEAYLDRCLESITAQTYRNLEILLIDDGSPDRSGAICDAWAAKDSRIRVVHKENTGAGPSRNVGLEMAQGELIGFVDSDDYIAPEMYEKLYEGMGKNVDIVECGYCTTESDDASFAVDRMASAHYTREEAMGLHIQDSLFSQLIWNKLYRRKVLESVRFPAGTTIDDEFFTYQALGNARELVHCDMICYAYRQQPGSIMHTLRSPQKYNAIQAKQKRLAYLRETMPGLVPGAKEDLLLTCLYAMQDCLRYLKGQELKEAKAFLHSTVDSLMPLPTEKTLPVKKKALLRMTKGSLEGTARLVNLLVDLHVFS